MHERGSSQVGLSYTGGGYDDTQRGVWLVGKRVADVVLASTAQGFGVSRVASARYIGHFGGLFFDRLIPLHR